MRNKSYEFMNYFIFKRIFYSKTSLVSILQKTNLLRTLYMNDTQLLLSAYTVAGNTDTNTSHIDSRIGTKYKRLVNTDKKTMKFFSNRNTKKYQQIF